MEIAGVCNVAAIHPVLLHHDAQASTLPVYPMHPGEINTSCIKFCTQHFWTSLLALWAA
jgi:hypothetical protein